MTKNLLSSRTIWMAFLIFGASLLNGLGVIDVSLEQNAMWIGMAIGVIQFILRIITKSEIVIK